MISFRKFTKDNYQKIVNFENINPFDILGPHYNSEKKEFFVNCYFPNAEEVRIIPAIQTRKEQVMKRVEGSDLFQASFRNVGEEFGYKFETE